MKEGFSLKYKDRRLLTKSRFVTGIWENLEKMVKNPNDYAEHSFRIGAATSASKRGLDEATRDVGSLGELCLPTPVY